MSGKYTADSDNDLLGKIRQDDRDAFKMLYNRYSRKIYLFALKYTGNKNEAEDIIQSVFVNVWENRASLSPAGSAKNYLYKAVVNHIINYLRKQAIHARFVEALVHSKETDSEMTIEQVFFNDLDRAIEDAVKTLPPKQQNIFRLSRNDGLTYPQIATKLDLSLRTVENQMYRALKTVKTILREKYFSF